MGCIHGLRFKECKICVSDSKKKYRRTHEIQIKQYMKDYRARNREGIRQYMNAYYLANLETHKQKMKIWRETNKEEIKKIKKEKYLINKLEILQHQREYNLLIKKQLISYYGNGIFKCVMCGFSDLNALCIDHIEGGGNKHRKEVGGGFRFYRWLIKNNYPEGFQTLCYNCNWLKRLSQERHGKVKNKKKNETTLAYFKRMKNLVFQKYSGNVKPSCKFCGTNESSVLSIDHINGKGTAERKAIGFGNTFYIWLVKNGFPEGYQVLCLNCQMIKRTNNNEARRMQILTNNN